MSDLSERLRAAADGWEWKRMQTTPRGPVVPLLLREAADALDARERDRDEAVALLLKLRPIVAGFGDGGIIYRDELEIRKEYDAFLARIEANT